MSAKQQTISTLRSLLRVFGKAHRHGEGPVRYHFQMNNQWRSYVIEQFREHQFESDQKKVDQLHQKAKDVLQMYENNLDLKYLRFLDTGVKPFISETDRVKTAAQRVGLEVTDVDSPSDVIAKQMEVDAEEALSQKYREKHASILSKALGQASVGRRRGGAVSHENVDEK